MKIFSLSYLFSTMPASSSHFMEGWGIFFLVLFIAGVALAAWLRYTRSEAIWRRVVRSVPSKLIGYGLGGLVLVFFRLEGAQYLNMRIWFLLYLLWLVWVAFSTIRTARKDYDQRLGMRAGRSQTKGTSYLPQPKKGKKGKKRK